MQKLVDFTELQTLQIDQIYKLFNSLLTNTKNEPDRIGSEFICPHTVICNLDRMEFEKKLCNICPSKGFQSKKFQLSGILFFLLGGLKQGQGKVEEFYDYQCDFFSPVYGILSKEQTFRRLCFLINETLYERKITMYQKINSLNNQIQPEIKSYELKKFCIVIVDPGLGLLKKYKDFDEITLVTSFKIFMEQFQQLLTILELRFTDFKICIHNVFLGSKNKTYYHLKFNLFYDYICKCNQNKLSVLFYQCLINQNYQRNSQSQIQSLTSDVLKLSQNSYEDDDFIELMNLLQEYLNNQQSMVQSSLFTQNISFFSREIMQQLKQFQTEDQLWKGYKILFQQEIVELIENQISKNGNTSTLPQNQQFESYKVQIQLIQEFQNYKSILIFNKILNKYSNLIQKQKVDKFDDFDYINQGILLKKRVELFKFLKQFNIFQDYINYCNQQNLTPIFEEINYNIIKQYEEDLKAGKIQ